MFEIKRFGITNHCIKNQWDAFLHSDGNVYRTCEYWPTRELAQAVLDKYQPPTAKHVWEHGDVFRSGSGHIMMYVQVHGKFHQAIDFDNKFSSDSRGLDVDCCLIGAKFLFNIRSKLQNKLNL